MASPLKSDEEETVMTKKICGILGGMGPEATVDLMGRIVNITAASQDGDHVHCLVDQNPQVPSRIKAILEGGENPGPVLAEMARKLQEAGADFLCMPCNTAHYWLNDAKGAVTIPFLNMPALAAAKAARGLGDAQGRKCGILGTTATREKEIYRPHCQSQGMETVYPTDADQAELLNIINEVKAGDHSGGQRFARIAQNLADSGAAALIIACTELSYLGLPDSVTALVVDAADALAEAVVEESGARLKG